MHRNWRIWTGNNWLIDVMPSIRRVHTFYIYVYAKRNVLQLDYLRFVPKFSYKQFPEHVFVVEKGFQPVSNYRLARGAEITANFMPASNSYLGWSKQRIRGIIQVGGLLYELDQIVQGQRLKGWPCKNLSLSP